MLIAAFFLLGINARFLWQILARKRLASRPENSPRKAATIWYERMTVVMGRSGWRKSPTQTPEEFIRLIADDAVRRQSSRIYPPL